MISSLIRACVVVVFGLVGYTSWGFTKKFLRESRLFAKIAAVANIDPQEKAAAAKLQPAVDPVQQEMETFRRQWNESFGARNFDELENAARELRETKALFRNGNWKLMEFYEAFSVAEKAPDDAWRKREELHLDWLAAKPGSITAQVAYADFLSDYAWHARGTGFSNTVSKEGWELFGQRLAACAGELEKARTLSEMDPMWFYIALRVGLGFSWEKPDFASVVEDAHAFEPHFWRHDLIHAIALMPRWYGSPGDWEAYAAKAASRPDGPGAEVYARIVMFMAGYHENIFRETQASWPRTLEGLTQLRLKYPDAIEFTSFAALLATMAEDRATAKPMFDALGDTCQPSVFKSRERFAHYRNWANTGKW